MMWGFEEPRFQALKIAALSHPDPSVREAAADVLLWDEPMAAEEPLLAALADREERVVLAAANTLQYYPTRRTLTRLAELADREGKPGEQAKCSFDELRWTFQSAFQYAEGSEREELLGWMQPVWSILAFTKDELLPETRESVVRAKPVQDIVTADELLELLSDPDGPWAEKKRRLDRADPAGFSPAAIARLLPFLATHLDPAVRSGGARLLAAWDQYDALLALLEDPRFYVMKTAMYHLGKITASPRVAERALRHLLDPGVTSTHAYETLDTYVAHAPAEETIPRLAELAAREERETVRRNAIDALMKLGAAREVEPLLSLLEAPPLMTWSVHIALLEAASTLGLAPRGLDALREVDNLDLRKTIARFGRSSARLG
jgi:HEAT repeat protein